MRNTLVLLAATALGAAACSDSANTPVKPATVLESGIPLKLEVMADPAKLYRLVVLFTQFNDDYKQPPIDVAVDVAFDPKATSFDFPTPTLPSAANVLCERASDGRASKQQLPGACDASSKYHAAIGIVAIVEDSNRDGKSDFVLQNGRIDLNDSSFFAFGHAIVLHDATGGSEFIFKDGTKALMNLPVPKGFSLWETYEPANGFERLRIRTGPIVFNNKFPNLD